MLLLARLNGTRARLQPTEALATCAETRHSACRTTVERWQLPALCSPLVVNMARLRLRNGLSSI